MSVIGVFAAQNVLAGGSGRPRGIGCPAGSTPAAISSNLGELRSVVAASGLLALRSGGTGDIQGLQQPSSSWSDAFPSPRSDAVANSVAVTAGYEIRWWSSDEDHQAADVFVLRGPADAARYVDEAASPRCRKQAVAYRLSQPAGARALIWTNPDRVREADVFFSRGSRAYRLVDVPPPSYLQGRFPLDAAELIALPQLLACRLKEAGCERAAPRPVLTPAGYDAFKLLLAGEWSFRSLPAYMAAGVFSRECTAISRFWDPDARLIYQGCQVDWHYFSVAAYARRCDRARTCRHWAIETAVSDLHRMATLERQVAGQLTTGPCRAAWNLYATRNDQLGDAFALYGQALAAHDRRQLARARRLSRGADRGINPFAAVGSCAPDGASPGLPQLI